MFVNIRGGYVNIKNNRLKQRKIKIGGMSKQDVLNDVLEDRKVEKLTHNLNHIKLSKPRFNTQKYISFM